MRTVFGTLGCAAGVVLGLVLTSAAHAQAPRAGVHRMEINNGSTQTVRYFGVRLSPGESATLRDLERGENELAYLRNLQNLKRQYVSDERRLEATRSQAQQEFYGRYMAAGGFGGLGNFATLGLDSSYLAALNLRGGYNGAEGLGGAYGGYFAPGLYSGLGYGRGISGVLGSGTVASGLGCGVGIDDPIKDSLASVIAKQATPEYAALVNRDLDRAMSQAGASKTLSVALGLPDASRDSEAYIRPVAAEMEPSAPVVVTLKDGTVLRGSKLEETKDWVTVITGKGRKTRVRPADVVRIDEGKSGVVPAVGD